MRRSVFNMLIGFLTLAAGLVGVQIVRMIDIRQHESSSLQGQSLSRVEGGDSKRPQAVTSYSETAIGPPTRFTATGIRSDDEVTAFYLKFQKAIAEDDRNEVASMMLYPLRVNFPSDKLGRPYTIIRTRRQFLRAYDKIFGPRVKDFITSVDVEDREQLWARFDGIAVGRGTIWIGVFCEDRLCESGRYHLNVRTIHGNSGLDLQ